MKNLFTISIIAFFIILHFKSEAQICLMPQAGINITPSSADQLCKADFNNDGKTDFASVNGDATVTILLSNGTGGFLSITNDTSTLLASTICTADFNGDGKADLAVHNWGPGNISILLGDGTGGFSLIPNSVNTGIYNINSSLCSADFNGDGKMDLALSSGFSYVAIGLGNGDGTFGTMNHITTTAAINGQLITADFNNDSNADLATVGVVLLGNGAAGFTSSATFSSVNYPKSLVSDDFNNDGKLDLVIAERGINAAGDVSLYIGNGLGGFATPVMFSIGDSTVVPNNNPSSNLICSGDFDGDGKKDLAIGTWTNSTTLIESNVTVLKGNGSGGFALPVNLHVPDYTKSIISTDLNSDGKADLAVLTRNNTDSAMVTTLLSCATTSTDNLNRTESEITVFPNPTSEVLNILSTENITSVKITNMLGQVIYQSFPNSKKINPELSNEGFYLITISTATTITTKRIIVVH